MDASQPNNLLRSRMQWKIIAVENDVELLLQLSTVQVRWLPVIKDKSVQFTGSG